MPKSMVTDGTFRLPVEDELYRSRLTGCENVKITPKDASKKPFYKWRWTFEILSGVTTGMEYAGTTVNGDTWDRITTAEDNTARQWYETLLDREVALGEDCDTDLCIGHECQITVKYREPYLRKDGQGMITPFEVDDVYPLEREDVDPPF